MGPMPSKTCTCESMSPGVTIFALAETTLRARATGITGDSSRILPFFTATSSAVCRFCPGSMTVPPLINKSQSGGALWAGEARGALARPKLPEASRPDPTINLENWRRVSIKHLFAPFAHVRGVPWFGIRWVEKSSLGESDEFNFDATSVQPGHLDRGASGRMRGKVAAGDFTHRFKIIHILQIDCCLHRPIER